MQELCTNGGILSLCQTILKLKVPDSFMDSLGIVAAISRLKSKVLAIVSSMKPNSSLTYPFQHLAYFRTNIDASWWILLLQLLQLCEAESVSYLDEVAGSSKSMRLAKSVVLEVSLLLS